MNSDSRLAQCPWLQPYSAAVYASEAVVKLFDSREAFRSSLVQNLFAANAGFCLGEIKQVKDGPLDDTSRKLLGALLQKICQRGLPAPCSLSLERHVLTEAQVAGLLNFKESTEGGEFRFACRSRVPGLDLLLKASLFSPLCIPDADVNGLLDCYRSLCTEVESEFFDTFLSVTGEPRLALFMTPQRDLGSLLLCQLPEGTYSADRVDFAIELPYMTQDSWLRMVIELDDDTHTGARAIQDGKRDTALRQAGWQVLRIKVRERSRWQSVLSQVAAQLRRALTEDVLKAAASLRSLPYEQSRAIHALVQLPLAEARITAVLAHLIYHRGTADVIVDDVQNLGLEIVLRTAIHTLESLLPLHNFGSPGKPRIHETRTDETVITYFGFPSPKAWDQISTLGSVVVCPRPVSPEYREPLHPAIPRPVDLSSPQREDAVRKSLVFLLQNVLRKVEFRPGQFEIIKRALTNKPVVGLLPTAGGKSLCYQLACFTQPGFVLAVDPLRSLMLDQQENLSAMGIHRTTAIISGMEATEVQDRMFREESYRAIEKGDYLFVFVAPERLQMPDFRDHVRSFTANLPIPFCVVDEAHCVSEWGHDFRPAYLNVGRIVREYCHYAGFQPSLLALTGTASKNVLVDILRELEINDHEALVEPRSFDRQELQFEVSIAPSRDRLAVLRGKLRAILQELGWAPGQPYSLPSGLIFTYFVNDRTVGVPLLVENLRNGLGIPVDMYSGTPPFGVSDNRLEWEQKKIETQRKFKRGEVSILVCTHSFGMGIDKPDIRFTLHAMLPRSLEEFYQQSGRAGRDGRQAKCVIVFCDDQPSLADEILDTELTSLEEIAEKTEKVERQSRGDAIRNTWFLTNSFVGRDTEKRILEYVLRTLILPRLDTHVGDSASFDISFLALPQHLFKGKIDRDQRESALEKALYRLLLVGGLHDYMKDFTARIFQVEVRRLPPEGVFRKFEEYLRRYSTEGEVRSYLPSEVPKSFEEAVVRCGFRLIDYIYENVEKRRRRAIGQMLQTARDAVVQGQHAFREQLLAYLEESEFTEPVRQLSEQIDPATWFKLLANVKGIDGVTKLLGACRRQLEESPSHPGLLILAGIARAATPNPKQANIDIRGGFIALKRYYSDPRNRLWVAQNVLVHARRLAPQQIDMVLLAILEGDHSIELLRYGYKVAERDSNAHWFSIISLASNLVEVIQQCRKNSQGNKKEEPRY